MVTKHVFCLCVIVCCVLTGSVAFANDPNLPNYTPAGGQGYSEMGSGMSLGFDPDDYDFLIYDCGGDGSQNSIQAAMQKIGIQEFTVCDAYNAVTLELLQSHDILIVGWSAGGDKSGLGANVIEQDIAGRVILSGHDSDYHTVNVEQEDAGTTFFIQEINYVLQGSGTGLIVCADIDNNFDWLPASWGVESTTNSGAEVIPFTQEGLDSGVYDNLTPELMSNWSTSFHNTFTDWGDGFVSFELGKVNDVDSVITIAATVNPYGFPFDKEDDVDEGDCRSPEEEITYTICWENSTDQTFTDVWIIDYLPSGVTYPEGFWTLNPNNTPVPPDPAYDPNTHSYAWEIETVAPNDANCVTLTVTVNYKAEPGMYLHNVAEIWTGNTLLTRATEDTPVCCWDIEDPNIIYVDMTATGNNNGVDWENAYSGEDGLQSALFRARYGTCGPYTIYVAQGIYSPGNYGSDSFEVPEGSSVYGGFMVGGSDFSERNSYKYKTILTGYTYISNEPNDVSYNYELNDTVVTMGDETRLDGFTVTGAAIAGYGIYGSGVDFTIENCSIEKNEGYGIRAIDGTVIIKWCSVRRNRLDGIRHQGEGFTLTIENTQIRQNMRYGVYSQNSTPTIKNSVVSENDLLKEGRQGIRMINPAYNPVLHNNTIAYNRAAGISFVDNGDITGDPNNKDWPDVQNCILWHNNMAAEMPVQFAGFSKDRIYYSCIYDPNNDDLSLDDNYNFSANPKFAYYDPNNVHLAYDSPCKDKGNPGLSYAQQLDMDSEERVVGDYVDVGADELYSCDDDLSEDDIYNALDWNADGVVNYYEFSEFSSAWLSHNPNEPGLIDPNDAINWNSACNLYDTGGSESEYVIDLADLVVFASETSWLWEACWRDNYIEMYGMMMGGGESMMLMPVAFGFTAVSEEAEPEPVERTTAELVSLVEGIYGIIEYVDTSIEEGHENAENLYEIKTFLEGVLLELQADL